MSEVERYRKKIVPPMPLLAGAGVSAAAFVGASAAQMWALLGVSAVVFIILAVVIFRDYPQPKTDIPEVREGDWGTAGWWIVLLAFAAVIPANNLLVDVLGAPPWLGMTASAVAAGAVFTHRVRRAYLMTPAIGGRRARKILEATEPVEMIDGSEQAEVDAVVKKYHSLLAAMVACGAIDGIMVRVDSVARLLECEVEDVYAEMKDLASHRLLRIRQWSNSQALATREATITTSGVRAMA